MPRSPNGGTLYLCSAPILWANRDRLPTAHYPCLRYELRRMSYDFAGQPYQEPGRP